MITDDMRHPIKPAEVKRQDLTESAEMFYDALCSAGLSHERAMHTLHVMARDVSGRRYVPTLKHSRGAAAKRKARTMIARGAKDKEVQEKTGLSERELRRIKRELDEEMEPDTAQAEPA
jgi:Mor family transcriptional regulator